MMVKTADGSNRVTTLAAPGDHHSGDHRDRTDAWWVAIGPPDGAALWADGGHGRDRAAGPLAGKMQTGAARSGNLSGPGGKDGLSGEDIRSTARGLT